MFVCVGSILPAGGWMQIRLPSLFFQQITRPSRYALVSVDYCVQRSVACLAKDVPRSNLEEMATPFTYRLV